MEAGERYVFSVYCAALGSVADPSRVVVNHAPFSMATVVGGPDARPKLGDMVPGQRFHYVFDAVTSGQLRLILGLDGSGDVTLERPMLDKSAALRAYVASGELEVTPVGPMNWDSVPYFGWYEGSLKVGSANMSQRIRAGYFGYRMTMRRAGSLAAVQSHLASNRVNETSKSRVNGNDDHSYPASWKLGFRVFDADANWQPAGEPLRDIPFRYTNPNGNPDDTRAVFEFDMQNLPVSEGQRLLFLFYSRESDPVNNHPSVNMTMNRGRPDLGQNPPRAVNLFYGDDPIHVRNANLAPGQNGELFNLGIRYADGVEDGSISIDATPSAFRTDLGGSNRVRQRWTSPYWRRTSEILLAAYRRPDAMPQAALTVQISGPDISTMTLTIQPSDIQVFDEESRTSYHYTNQKFALPGELLLSPETVYTVEIHSSGTTSGRYRIHGVRHHSDGYMNAGNTDLPIPAGGVEPIEPHKWSGTGEKSANGGTSWSPVGWAGGRADLPIAFVINRKMAKTLQELPQ